MNKKKTHCPKCGSQKTKKNGHIRGVQQHRCQECVYQFTSHRRQKNIEQNHIWRDYCFEKQTVRELSEVYGKDRRTIRKILNGYIPPHKHHIPRPVHIVTDVTYFGERTEDTSWCVAVARDPIEGEDLVWGFGQTESTSLYRILRDELEHLGYTILSVTADVFSGIHSAFSHIPFQMCQVHMERLVIKGTTKKPQTEAGQVLLSLTRTLHTTNSHTFPTRCNKYIEKYQQFLNEKTKHPLTGDWSWSHENLKRATSSLLTLKKFLFTFEHNTNIPKTTNSLDGRFSHIKDILTIHRGVSLVHKQKLIHSILLASTIAPSPEKLKQIL